MIQVRIGEQVHTWSFDQWEERVAAGRVPADALVCFSPVTGDGWRRADELEMYRSLRHDALGRWQVAAGGAPVLTALLVGVQVRIFWWARLPEVRDLVVSRFTSATPQVLEDRELWRLLSMGFLQVEPMHLALNMMWLAYVGWNLERTLGRVQLGVLYAFCVLSGSIFSVFGSPWVPSLGASGGVFGLVAAAATFGLVRSDLLRGRLSRGFGLAMVPYLLLMFWSGLQNEGVDNWCHLGGIISGGLLGLFLDPPTLERSPNWNRRVWTGTGSVAAVAVAAIAAIGPRAEPLVDVLVARAHADPRRAEAEIPAQRELAWVVPAAWRAGQGIVLRSSWCSTSSDRCFGARSDVAERFVVDVASLAEPVEASIRQDWPAATVEPVELTELGGRPAAHLVARVTRGGVPLRVEWWGVARGVHTLQVGWQVEEHRADDLAPLRRRLLDGVVWSDPDELVRAAEADLRPTVRTREDHAAALAGVGEVERALALHEEILAGPGGDAPERVVALLRTLAVVGAAVGDPEPWWTRALAAAHEPSVPVALADAMDAEGRPWEARAVLELAWERWPGDRGVSRARRARELSRTLDADGRPWPLVFDPTTRIPRAPEAVAAREALALDLPTVAAEAQRLRGEQDAILAAGADRIARRDPAGLDDLVVAASGEWSAGDAPQERRRVASELLRAVDGGAGAPTWPDARLLDVAREVRPWLEEQVAEAPATP